MDFFGFCPRLCCPIVVFSMHATTYNCCFLFHNRGNTKHHHYHRKGWGNPLFISTTVQFPLNIVQFFDTTSWNPQGWFSKLLILQPKNTHVSFNWKMLNLVRQIKAACRLMELYEYFCGEYDFAGKTSIILSFDQTLLKKKSKLSPYHQIFFAIFLQIFCNCIAD